MVGKRTGKGSAFDFDSVKCVLFIVVYMSSDNE